MSRLTPRPIFHTAMNSRHGKGLRPILHTAMSSRHGKGLPKAARRKAAAVMGAKAPHFAAAKTVVTFMYGGKGGKEKTPVVALVKERKGHWAGGSFNLPGGAYEAKDQYIRATAQRECEEEGLSNMLLPASFHYLGTLDNRTAIYTAKVNPSRSRRRVHFEQNKETTEVDYFPLCNLLLNAFNVGVGTSEEHRSIRNVNGNVRKVHRSVISTTMMMLFPRHWKSMHKMWV